MKKSILAIALCGCCVAAQAAGPGAEWTAPPPPPLPPAGAGALPPPVPNPDADEALPAPEVRIYPSQRGQVEEFSINGQVYMMRITPAWGPPYYLVDRDGDGSLETSHYSPAHPGILPHQWLLYSW